MVEAEADIRTRHGEPLHHVDRGAVFRPCRAEELAARRHPREQLLDGDSRAGRERCRPLPRRLSLVDRARPAVLSPRSEEHTSALQSLMRISYAVFGLKKKKQTKP